MSAVGFGCGSTGGLFVRGTFEEQIAALECAIRSGVTYVDTAAQYGDGTSEQNLGRVIRELGISPIIGTKLHIRPDEVGRAKKILQQRIEKSLKRLGMSRVDVCTLHTRVGSGFDELRATDVVEVIAPALRDLADEGLASAIGFTGLGETQALLEVAASGAFDSFQCYYNLLNQSADIPGSADGKSQDFEGLLNLAGDQGIGAIGIRILAGGALTGDNSRHQTAGPVGRPMAKGEEYEDDMARARLYGEVVSRFEVASLPELAYRFALSNQKLSCILGGFSDTKQVQQMLDFVAKGPLPDHVLAELKTFKPKGIRAIGRRTARLPTPKGARPRCQDLRRILLVSRYDPTARSRPCLI
ncbi:MAG TPA: aldo/keto reductase [Acidimicrobiales bacterium]|nr:aldo/keto reductase [Acidimicrobiales bacterium]